ncbi:MAG: hypothetical protein LBS22_01640 [Puniceicoccales bacterium]|jgi:hypothetical protein|nr:hypothetical protein [Puniceicoccales bacterium]
MKDAVEGGPFLGDFPVILYTPKWRSYGLVIKGNPRNQYILFYCPFCGKKLPTDLVDEHFDAIRDDTGKPLDPLPEEFKTDEWWKKRRL